MKTRNPEMGSLKKSSTPERGRPCALRGPVRVLTASWLLLGAATLSVLPTPALAQHHMDWIAIGAAGGVSAGGVFTMHDMVAQPEAGRLRGGNFTVTGGFWGVLAEPPPQLMLGYSNGMVVVSWLRSAAGYLLDQAATLSDPPVAWSRVNASEYQTNATHIYLAVPGPTARMFYRLRRP